MQHLKIYDLDGTVIDSSHRYQADKTGRAIDLAHWRKNCTEDMIKKDSLLPLADQMIFDLDQVNTVVIVATARVMTSHDFNFITENIGIPNFTVHRQGEHDNRKGADLKVTGINEVVNIHGFESITIYEDNMTYLTGMTEHFEAMGHESVYPIFIQSNQGH